MIDRYLLNTHGSSSAASTPASAAGPRGRRRMNPRMAGMCDRLCGNCANFNALDDLPADPCKWFGVCMQEVERDLGCECDTNKVLIWVYDHGRRGQDYCKRPDEWFEEW